MDDASEPVKALIEPSSKAVGFMLGALLGSIAVYLFTAVPFTIGFVVVPALYPSIAGSSFLIAILLPVAFGAVLGGFSGMALATRTPLSWTFAAAPLIVVALNTWRMYTVPGSEGQLLVLVAAYFVGGSAFPLGFLAGIRKRTGS